jgi:hypothetical protein
MKRIFRFLLLVSLCFTLAAQHVQPKNSVLKSALFPGWGELSYGSKSAYLFLGAEAALWMSFAGLRYSGHVQNLDLISYARLHAGVSEYPESKEYWADLGNFISYEDHEEEMLENRTPENIWSADYQWNWDSQNELSEFKELYRKKELTLLGSEFVITGMIVNRIASVINVRYLKNKSVKVSAFATPVKGGGYLEIGLSF